MMMPDSPRVSEAAAASPGGLSAAELPPPPLSGEMEAGDDGLRVDWRAVLLAVPAFLVIMGVPWLVATQMQWREPEGTTGDAARAICMVGCAWFVDRIVPGLRVTGRWAIAMGGGAVVSSGGLEVLPSVCCQGRTPMTFVTLVAETGLAALLGVVMGYCLGMAARKRESRASGMMLASGTVWLPYVLVIVGVRVLAWQGWRPMLQGLRTSAGQLGVDAAVGLVWAVVLGAVMAYGVHVTERRNA